MWYLLFFLWLFLLVFSQHIYFHSYIIQAILWSPVTDLYTFNSLMGYNNILCQNTTEFHNPFEFSSAWEDTYHKSCRYMLFCGISAWVVNAVFPFSPVLPPVRKCHLNWRVNWRVHVALWWAVHLNKFLCSAFYVYLFWPFISWNLCLKNRTFMLLVKASWAKKKPRRYCLH